MTCLSCVCLVRVLCLWCVRVVLFSRVRACAMVVSCGLVYVLFLIVCVGSVFCEW